MSSKAEGVLIIGYGNSLRGDDDAGRAVARELRRRGLAAIETHQLTPELAQTISQARLALFVDADAMREPGRICVDAVAESNPSVFEHKTSPQILLRLAREVYGRAPTALLVAIGAASYDIGGGLSRPVRDAVRKTVNGIACFARRQRCQDAKTGEEARESYLAATFDGAGLPQAGDPVAS